MIPRLALFLAGILVLTVVLTAAVPLAAVVAEEPIYSPKPARPPATPGPHFAFQQAQLAQSTGITRLDLPASTESSGPPPAGSVFANAVMPTPLPQVRQVATAIGDVISDAKKANPRLNARDVRAVVQDGDMIISWSSATAAPSR
jgi:hypothetical protein